MLNTNFYEINTLLLGGKKSNTLQLGGTKTL